MNTIINKSARSSHLDQQVSVELITPDVAHEMLGRNTHNRNPRKATVSAYARDMLNGDWRWNGESIKFASDGTLLDGQHRLMAVIESGVSVQTLVIRGLPNEVQETVDGGAKRTFSDVLRLRGETNCTVLAATVRSVSTWKNGYRSMKGSGKHTNAQLLSTLEEIPWLRDGMTQISRVQASVHLPASVGGLCWWLFMSIDAEDANFFFEALSSGENMAAGDPIYELRRVLSSSQDAIRGERNLTWLLAVVIKAWNKYRDGEKVAQLKFRPGGANPERMPEPR